MKMKTKVKIAFALSFLAALAYAIRNMDASMIIKALGYALIISVPLSYLVRKNLSKLNNALTKGVVILTVPVSLFFVKWLHSRSIYGETVFIFILSIVMIIISFTASQKELEDMFK